MHKFVAVVAGVTMFIAPSIASASSGVGTTDWGTSGSTSTVTTTSTSTLPSWTSTATSGSGSESWNSSASLPSWTATATSGTGVADWTATTATTTSTASMPDWTKTATSGTGTENWNTTASLPSWTSTATNGSGNTEWTSTSTLPSWTSTATSGSGNTDWNATSTLPEWTKNATKGTGTTEWNTLPTWTDTSTSGTGNSDWNAPIECQGETIVNNPSFPDTKNHWGREYICRAYKLGIISGYLAGPHQGLFKPDNNVTRAELLKTVMKMQGIQLSNTSAKSTFKDVEANAWYTGYVAKAKELGIIEGYKDGTFKPHKAVNRAEAVKIILLASGVTMADVSAEGSLQAADADSIAEFSDVKENLWFANYVSLAQKKGILNGKQDGLFHASDNMTRAEMVKVVLLSFDTIR